MKTTMMLCDHVEVAEGKLFINGGGWTIINPGQNVYGIAILIDVPWDQTNTKHTALLELLTSDGDPVTIDGEDGEVVPVSHPIGFEVGRPVGTKPGTPVAVTIPVNLQPGPPLPAGEQFVWQLSIDGHSDEDWRLGFATRPSAGPQSMAA
jgi:hypothetical protein